MAPRRKFGAFSGVFTPSILTILGVIMYLRLPAVVGNAGMWAAIGIIIAAHVISVTTGLSVSSIATDKRVRAGGSYYIISRSLGLPIGGTLGLALFVGLSFSVSLYLIGFAESFLTYWEIGIDPATGRPDIASIRIAGTIALTTVTVVTFISTSLAIKTQYVIMAAIALSLLSIFIGNPDLPAAEAVHVDPLPGGTSLIVLFAIFFPAVTGFEAGVSMSGDLKDPKRDIPSGTLIAIGVGLVVYIGEVIFFSYRIPADQLAHNPRVLLDYSLSAPLVVAGIWGATISSALGSILGAPRILQAAALDRIAPRFFAKGAGPDNEPRNAVLLAFVIAEGGILIGSLDAIAAIVTMFFMASYGVLNLSCAIESWVSPDFRPDFKIPRFVSLIGAATCAGLMVMLDLAAMAGATVIMAAVYLWLKRKQLALEGGDTWTGIWSSVTRKALDRLSRSPTHERNWRPNVLLFTGHRTPDHLRAFGTSLVENNGVLTELHLHPTGSSPSAARAPAPDGERPVGYHVRPLATDEPVDALLGVARYHGIAGFEPNTVIVDWALLANHTDRADALLSELHALGRHALVALPGAARPAPHATTPILDVWWRGDGRNAALGLALVRFLSTAHDWVQATPRFFCTVADPSQKRAVEHRISAWLSDARVRAEVRVFDAPTAPDTYEALVARTSHRASLVVLGLAPPTDGEPTAASAGLVETVSRLAELERPTLLALAAPTFDDPFPHVDLTAAQRGLAPSDQPEAWRARPATLDLGVDDVLARHVLDYHDQLAQVAHAFQDHGPRPLLAPLRVAEEEIVRLTQRALDQLERAAGMSAGQRQRRTVYRIERGLIRAIRDVLVQLAEALGDGERETLSVALGVLGEQLRAVEDAAAEVLIVTTGRDGRQRALPLVHDGRGDLEVAKTLGRLGRDYVRWPLRRFVARLHARDGQLAMQRALGQLIEARTRLLGALDGLAAWALAEVGRGARRLCAPEGETPWTPPRVALDERAAGWRALLDAAGGAQAQAGATFARDAAQRVAEALADASRTWKVPAAKGADAAPIDVPPLVEEAGGALALQRHFVARSELDVALRGLHRDLEAMVDQATAELRARIAQRALVELDGFLADLRALEERLRHEPCSTHDLRVPSDLSVDDQGTLRRMTDVVERATEALPETIETLSEPSFQALADGRLDDLEQVSIAARRLVAFIVKTDLVGAARESLAQLAAVTARASNAVRDVARLVSFAGSAAVADAEQEVLVEERLEIVSAAIERVTVEREQVEAAWSRTQARLRELLEAVVERTRISAIGMSAGKLDRFIRTHESKGIGGWLRGVAQRVRDGIRRTMVDLSYRWSRGVLLARRLEASPDEPASAVERCIALHRASTPSVAVRDALPIFYRQVFLGRAASDPAYWLPVADELAAARAAIASHRAGHPGALWVTGAPRSGVGAVLRRVTGELVAGSAFAVRPVDGGTVDTERFDEALRTAIGLSGDVDTLLANLPEDAAVVIDELELWWERSAGGLAVLERLEGLITRHGHRTLFIIGVNEHLMRLLRRLGVLVDQVLATVHCQPLEALRLREAVMRRHEATGLALRIEGDKSEPSEWKTARLFAGLFEYSGGHVGAALHAWIAHIVEVMPGHIVMRRFRPADLAPLDALEPDWVALVVELLMHRHITRERLARVTRLDDARLDAGLAGLIRAGLAARGESGVYAIDPFMVHHVDRWLRTREVL